MEKQSATKEPRGEVCTLIIDKAREHAVTRHAQEFSAISWREQTITTADYAILSPPPECRLLAVIERKTLDDYAASIKDGRHANKAKLIKARKQTGCRIIYIVEGRDPATRSDPQATQATCCRIPYSTIESSMIHLSLRDDIAHYRTRDSTHTARMLANMVKYYNSFLADGLPLPAPSPHMNASQNAEDETEDPMDSISLLTVVHKKTTHQIVCEMWGEYRGITSDSADNYISLWSLKDVIDKNISREELMNTQIRSRKLSRVVINSISSQDKTMETKLLARAPDISIVVARELMDKHSLREILAMSTEELSNICVGKRQNRLGVKAEKIHECFSYTTRPNKILEKPSETDSIALDNVPVEDVSTPIAKNIITSSKPRGRKKKNSM